MPVVQHTVVKPTVIAKTALGLLEQELILPRLFARQSLDQFKGAASDTLNYKVQGVLPFREYAFRNDRSNPIVFDTYAERTVPVTLSGNVYSAVQMIDEQADFDLARWSDLLEPQARAVAAGLERKCYDAIAAAPFATNIGDAAADPKGAIFEARRILNRYKVSGGRRVLLVGSDFENVLLTADKLGIASNVGDDRAQSVLEDATLGKLAGFTIVSAPDLAADEAIAMGDEAFALYTAVPSVPASVKAGGTTSYNGYAMRWLQDYSADYLTDRSVLNTYAGARSIPDPLLYRDATGQLKVTTDQSFVRAIKLHLAPKGHVAPVKGSQLDLATGVNSDKVWTAGGYKTLAAANA